jgi:hypothetical protein
VNALFFTQETSSHGILDAEILTVCEAVMIFDYFSSVQTLH